jgi:DNA-directed RNA polymerase subunit RPC12/RpoP
MTSTFLHGDNKIAPDELIERDAPYCPDCGYKMSVLRVDTTVSDSGTYSKYEYECLQCGSRVRTETTSEKTKPLAVI